MFAMVPKLCLRINSFLQKIADNLNAVDIEKFLKEDGFLSH